MDEKPSTSNTQTVIEETLNARRTESVDASAILQLTSDQTKKQFGDINIVHLIEKANLSVTLCNANNDVLGFSAFVDYPQIEYEICDSANWENWIRMLDTSALVNCSSINSLYMHYFTAHEDYTSITASEIIRAVFNAVSHLHFILLITKVDFPLEPALMNIFREVYTFKSNTNEFTLYITQRHEHVPALYIRQAVVEDTDDLTPLFTQLDSLLTDSYGEYFIAETIEAQNSENHCLAAEAGGKAVGFMSICSSVNTDFLQSCYELDAFHGLCKFHPNDNLQPKLSSIKDEPSEDLDEQLKSDNSDVDTNSVQIEDKAATTEHSEQTETASIRSESSNREVKLSEVHMSSSIMSHTESVTIPDKIDLSLSYHVQEDVKEEVFRPVYLGESNAFSIQLFCIEEAHEMRSVDFLPEMFKLFPDKDFAVISIPHLVPEFPLIQNFVRVTPKKSSNSPHELYVFHRHGLLASNFSVRKATKDDFDKVKHLVEKINLQDVLLKDLQKFNEARRDEDGREIQAFVADCLDQVVGICIIRREEDIEYIRSHYNIEDFIYYNHHRRDEHGHLNHFVLNPIFQNFSKIFLKEVLRQSKKSCLYYPIYTKQDEELIKKNSLITALNNLVPVRSRKQIVYPEKILGINSPSSRVLTAQIPYSLNHINRKLTLEPKVVINARIVIVGASDTALSFLEILCFCPHLRFNNLVLVSKRGLPTAEFKANAQNYSKEDLAKISLRTWVNVVTGVMTAMNRSHKQIILSDGSSVTYDYLILCTGQQYHIPAASGLDLNKLATNHDLSVQDINKPLSKNANVPQNVMALNDDYDYMLLTKWALQNTECENTAQKKNIVFYGKNFQCFLAIQHLLSCGISGSCIKLVNPPSANTTVSASCNYRRNVFKEPVITKAVYKALENAGIEVYENYVLASWFTEKDENGKENVTSLSFTTPDKPVNNFPCSAFISLHPLRINHETFSALNDSCIVFDGRLTIDADFKTNDPLIRAAGPLVKYRRRYHADAPAFRHENQSSREIGFRLAMSLLPIVDPTLEDLCGSLEKSAPKEDSSKEDLNEKFVPVYHEPKIISGILPGDFYYMHMRKPGAVVDYNLEVDRDDHGTEIITGSPCNGRFFRIHMNQFKCVETVTCLVNKENKHLFDFIPNIIQLYGVHERYINDLLQRYQENMIKDLYEFFTEPWSMILFHDRFPDLRQEIRDILGSHPIGASNLPSIEAMVNNLVEEDSFINDAQRETLTKHFNEIGQRKAVEKTLLSFINYNYYHLPMYAKPGMI